jgi:TPR repeat protein
MSAFRLVVPAVLALAAASGAQAFERDRASPAPALDQARALVEAVGIPAKSADGFAIAKKLADEGEGPVAVQAQWTVGNFYLNGIGTTASVEEAMVYLGKAKAAGLPEAARLLDRIEKR